MKIMYCPSRKQKNTHEFCVTQQQENKYDPKVLYYYENNVPPINKAKEYREFLVRQNNKYDFYYFLVLGD